MASARGRWSSVVERALLGSSFVAVALSTAVLTWIAVAPAARDHDVFIVGDSFSTVSRSSTGPQWPQILAAQCLLHMNRDAVPGTGYLSGRKQGNAFGQRLAKDMGHSSPGLVIFAGGRFDYDHYTAAQIEGAAAVVLDRWHAAQPHARLILLSPFSSGPPSPGLSELAHRFERLAPLHHATYIDVSTALGPGFVAHDGVTPDDRGQHLIASKVRAALETRGLL